MAFHTHLYQPGAGEVEELTFREHNIIPLKTVVAKSEKCNTNCVFGQKCAIHISKNATKESVNAQVGVMLKEIHFDWADHQL